VSRAAPNLSPGRLTAGDVVRVGAVGLRTRPLRALLSALGIALGVAAMLAVVGISASGRADLQGTLDALGTNLLTASAAGASGRGEDTRLPDGAVARIERIAPVTSAAALRRLPDDVNTYRHDRVPAEQTNGIAAYVADLDLPGTVGARIARGTWLNAATARYPAVVLGVNAAGRLGITEAGRLVHLGGEYFAVVGILEPVPLVPELDSAALVGPVAAQRYLGSGDDLPVTVYLRAAEDRVPAVRDVLAATANPHRALPGGGLPAVRRARRQDRHRACAQRVAAGPRRGGAAGRRRRRGEHDGDLGAGTAL
jgi:putative ABC transport system permease protein